MQRSYRGHLTQFGFHGCRLLGLHGNHDLRMDLAEFEVLGHAGRVTGNDFRLFELRDTALNRGPGKP